MPIKDFNNPLYGKEWRGGSSYRKFTYTLENVASVTGLTIATIRNDLLKRKVDKDDPDAMLKYIMSKGCKRAK